LNVFRIFALGVPHYLEDLGEHAERELFSLAGLRGRYNLGGGGGVGLGLDGLLRFLGGSGLTFPEPGVHKAGNYNINSGKSK